MPKAKSEKEVSNDGVTATIEIEAAAGAEKKGETVKTTYTVPASYKAFQEMVVGLDDKPDGGKFIKSVFGEAREDQNESPLAFVYRVYRSTIDRMARASVYEQAAQESTSITVGKDKVDIMTFPVARLVQAINGMRSQRSIRLLAMGASEGDVEAEKTVDRGLGFGPWKTAARKLTEGYVDANGANVKPQAVENAASGMLELTA